MEAVALPRRKQPSTEQYEMTRFSSDLLRKARMVIASITDEVSLGKYISEKARAGIEADYERVIREEAKKLGKSKD